MGWRRSCGGVCLPCRRGGGGGPRPGGLQLAVAAGTPESGVAVHARAVHLYQTWDGCTAEGQQVWETLRAESMPGQRLPAGAMAVMLERDEVPVAVWRGWVAACVRAERTEQGWTDVRQWAVSRFASSEEEAEAVLEGRDLDEEPDPRMRYLFIAVERSMRRVSCPSSGRRGDMLQRRAVGSTWAAWS